MTALMTWLARRRPGLAIRPGWPLALGAVAVAVATAGLTTLWAVSVGWLAVRLAVAGAVLLAIGLAAGSKGVIGFATLPALAGATVGLDRPQGHAWGQALLIAILWYVAVELAWAAVDERDGISRGPAVAQLRVREVATVVAVALVVGVAGSLLATMAPTRTAVVRAGVIVAVLTGVVAVGRHLAARAGLTDDPSP